MSKMGSHDSFEYLKHKLLPKEKPGIKVPIWLLTIKSWKSLWFICLHINGKLSMKATTLLHTSSQLKVCTKGYGLPKLWESAFWEFRDSQIGSHGTKWHLGAGPVANKKYYKREGGGFLQVRVVVNFMNMCLHVAHPFTKSAPLCINQLVVWFVQVHVNKWHVCHLS
jgi:hypothetical protein